MSCCTVRLPLLAIMGLAGLLMGGWPAMAVDRDPRPVGQVLDRAAQVLAGYGDQRLAAYGLLDVTKPPYEADPTGRRDCTAALQQAVQDARDARLLVWFPAGRYLVSGTIEACQRQVQSDRSRSPFSRDDYPCLLRGATAGGRATLVLADRAPGFTDPDNPRPVLFVTSGTADTPAQLQPNIAFNNHVVSLDVDLGQGNAGAIGVDNQGAQGTVTEDVHVVAEGAFAGFRGTSGSGGSASHLSVRGGRYGLYLAGLGEMSNFAGSQPSPVISALKLTGQTELAVLCATRGPLTLVGAEIDGAGIQLAGRRRPPAESALNLVDSLVRYQGDGAFIRGDRPVCLSNVYLQGAADIAQLDGLDPLQAAAGGWTHVSEYAAAPAGPWPLWVDGARRSEPLAVVGPGAPPDDLLRPHQWTDPLPDWDAPGVVNVKDAPFGALGDGQTDDTDALQRAIAAGRDVFVPKGHYRLSRTLRLRSDARLFGLGVYSILEPLPEAPAFADPTSPSPMIATPDAAAATCTVAFLELWCRHPGAYALHWQAGAGSMVRNVRTKPGPRVPRVALDDHPMILIDGQGGGRWYNALMHYKFAQGLHHRYILARGTRQPLAFYQLNPEHSAADHMVEFDDVQHLRIYAVKSETLGAGGPRALTPFLIRDSSDFRIFGHGGNASAAEGQPLYRLENCSDFLLANFTYQTLQGGAPAQTWFIVEERAADGAVVRTPATEHLALYQRR